MPFSNSMTAKTQLLIISVMQLLAWSSLPAFAATTIWSPVTIGIADVRIQSLAVDPKNPSTIYAGADKSRILKSSDAGGSWSMSYAPELYADGPPVALAVDPNNTGTVFAGLPSGALLKSSDAGTAWQNVPGWSGGWLTSVAIDPVLSHILYLVNDGFIWKSADDGASWQMPNVDLFNDWFKEVIIDPHVSTTLYAYSALMGGGVMKSVDGGTTWNYTGILIPSPIPSCPDGCWIFATPPNYHIQALALSPATPSVLFAGTTEGLFSSFDGGTSWQKATLGLTDTNVQTIAVDATNPAIIYAGTPSGVFTSLDNGLHWAATATGLSESNVIKLASAPTSPATVYAVTTGGLLFQGAPADAAPFLTLATPADNSVVSSAIISVTGWVSDTTAASVTINGAPAQQFKQDGNNFIATVNLTLGSNAILVTATDKKGATSSIQRNVTYDPTTPALTITTPSQDLVTHAKSVVVTGAVSAPGSGLKDLAFDCDGKSYFPLVNLDGTFSQRLTFSAFKTYIVTVSATDHAGKTSSYQRTIVYVPPAILSADVNGDNKVDVFDALLTLQSTIGLHHPADEITFKAAADVAPLDTAGKPKGDGAVDVFDALSILRHAVGLDGWQ